MHPITYELPGGARLNVTDPDMVPLGDVFSHRQITYTRDADDTGAAVELVFEIRDGVPMCASVRLWSESGDSGVRVKDLKRIPIERLVHDVFAYVGIYRPNPKGKGLVHVRGGADLFRRDRRSVELATTRRKVGPELLRRVASVHNSATEGTRIRAVRDEFDGISESQAKRYIKAAREKCFIK